MYLHIHIIYSHLGIFALFYFIQNLISCQALCLANKFYFGGSILLLLVNYLIIFLKANKSL